MGGRWGGSINRKKGDRYDLRERLGASPRRALPPRNYDLADQLGRPPARDPSGLQQGSQDRAAAWRGSPELA